MSLCQLYIKELFESKIVLKVALSEVISRYLEDKTRDFNQLLHDMRNSNLFEFLDEFDYKLTRQGKMLRHFMNLVEIMLLFIRATRQGIWDLHLPSLEMFVKYFFAYDQINYAKLTPVYLSEVLALKSQGQQSWKFLKSGNFSVKKSQVPFCALGTDHALEQENRKMEVLEGICGLANRKNALENYFLLSPLLGNISEQFCNYFGILQDNWSIHYQLGDAVNSRYFNNTEKRNTAFANHDVNFTSNTDVYNVITKKVLPKDQVDIFLAHDEVGCELFNLFRAERLSGI